MKLIDYLKINDIKMNHFARVVGCTQGYISLLCNEKRRPSPDIAILIEKATDGKVSVIEMLYPNQEIAA